MTYAEALAKLPADADLFCTFGYPGNPGFCGVYHAPEGMRWEIRNGCTRENWTVTKERRP